MEHFSSDWWGRGLREFTWLHWESAAPPSQQWNTTVWPSCESPAEEEEEGESLPSLWSQSLSKCELVPLTPFTPHPLTQVCSLVLLIKHSMFSCDLQLWFKIQSSYFIEIIEPTVVLTLYVFNVLLMLEIFIWDKSRTVSVLLVSVCCSQIKSSHRVSFSFFQFLSVIRKSLRSNWVVGESLHCSSRERTEDRREDPQHAIISLLLSDIPSSF